MKYQNVIWVLILCLRKKQFVYIEIKKLLEKKVIKGSRSEVNEFISGIFMRDKKGGER